MDVQGEENLSTAPQTCHAAEPWADSLLSWGLLQ